MNPESFKSHAVFSRIEQFEQAIRSENFSEKIGLDNFSFLETAYHFISNNLKLAIPVLVQEASLTSLATEIETATVQINTFLGNNNLGNITNAINSLNTAITRSKNLPHQSSDSDFDFAMSAAAFQENVKIAYENLKVQHNLLKIDLETSQNDLQIKQEAISNLEKQLTDKEIEIQNVLIKYNAEFESLKTSANTTVESERKKFIDTFEADRNVIKESIDIDRKTFEKIYQSMEAAFDTEAKGMIKKLDQKLAEANKIVNIVGNVGVTGNYQNIANQHKKSANTFRWIALGFMILMTGIIIYSIIELSRTDFNLYKSLVRILAAAALTYPAVYASRESSRHRSLETQNRNLELELASIGPFIELLPDENKLKIKEEMVNRYFGRQYEVADKNSNKNNDDTVTTLERIFKAIQPFIKK